MNPDLEKLVQLHHLETDLGRLDASLADLPRQRRELEGRITAGRAQLDSARAQLDASLKARKQHESAVLDFESKRSKYKGQLMDVKTNKEYTAMLHEIEGVEREIRSREDRILEEMERAESLSQEVKREEAAFRVVEQAGKVERSDLDGLEIALARQADARRSERDGVASGISEDLLALYRRVAKLRGTAVAEALDGVCQTCRVKMRLQVWVELKKNETLFQCESCGRILYYEPPPPTVVVEP